MHGARQLQTPLNGWLNGICEVVVVVEHYPKVDKGEAPGKHLSGNHIINHGKRERADATTKWLGKSRIVDSTDSGPKLAFLGCIEHPSVALPKAVLNGGESHEAFAQGLGWSVQYVRLS